MHRAWMIASRLVVRFTLGPLMGLVLVLSWLWDDKFHHTGGWDFLHPRCWLEGLFDA